MKEKKEIVIGERFGRLEIIENLGTKGKYYLRYVKVRCDCGTEKEIRFEYNLIHGKILSCGCYMKECRKNKATKHGLRHTNIYSVFNNMKYRCYNKTACNYDGYGGRGIAICNEWLGQDGFINFYNWAMKNGYKEGLSIDRINNDGNYSPNNCRWTDMSIQNINQRKRCTNTSGYIGVSYSEKRKKWASSVCYKGKAKNLGYSKTIYEAVKKRNDYILANNFPHKIQEVTQDE